jgi:hypothetical protein
MKEGYIRAPYIVFQDFIIMEECKSSSAIVPVVGPDCRESPLDSIVNILILDTAINATIPGG